jgi:uncharacterized protein YbaA (DUF1428 family)
MKAIFKDPELNGMMGEGEKPLFDGKRMVCGGFKVLVDL